MSRNRLADSASPYLRQHSDNPVHWWPWSREAFEEARARDVPVHLSIGYAACHWCHVMAHESFSDPAIAALMNERFVNIKVDREERPDVDQIYMQALHGLGEPGGWPLTMFLTPDGEPFWGGTYFPPRPAFGRPSFPQVLEALSQAWARRDPAIAQNGKALVAHLARAPEGAQGAPDPSVLDRAAESLLGHWDEAVGGFGGAPKFPQASVLDVLWRAHLRSGDEACERAVLTTLTSLCQGGIYDHLAGGLARYSTDAEWKVPHFEKMLYDNAQFLSGLALAFARTRDPLYRARMVETADWLIRDARTEEGAFAASFDADTEGEEGKTYVWSRDEILAVLGPEDGEYFSDIYDVRPNGNWERTNVLNRLAPRSRVWLGDAEEAHLAAFRARLLEVRERRAQPGRDDKVLADWNGMAVAALADASRILARPGWLEAARSAYGVVAGAMAEGGRLFHSRFGGRNTAPGLATDYAQMIRAALRLFSATGEARHLDDAKRWFEAVEGHHRDEAAGGYFLTADDAEALIVRPRAGRDEATPSAAGTMLQNAVALFQLTTEPRYRERAESLLAAEGGAIARDIQATASVQAGFDSLLRERLAVIAGEGEAADALAAAAAAEADPALLVLGAAAAAHLPAGHPAAANRAAGAALHLCDAVSCRPPVFDAGAAERLLEETRAFRAGALPFAS